MLHRHLDYPEETPVSQLGPAALDDLLDRGDLEAWAPLARAVRADPDGELADAVLHLVDAHPMYGTSPLWREWVGRLRRLGRQQERRVPLAELRRRRGFTQAHLGQRLGISQSDVSKLERRADLRLSTLRAYVASTGGSLRVMAVYAEGELTLDVG